MKKIIASIIALFITATTMAQVKLNLIVAAQPPAQLSEWSNRQEVLRAIISAQGVPAGFQYKIKTEIKTLDGTVIGSADLTRTPIFTMNSRGNTSFATKIVVPFELTVNMGVLARSADPITVPSRVFISVFILY